MTTPTFDARFVADHQDFLQRLARGLLGSAQGCDVDDAVQETWRLALEGTRAQQPRAFLATVLQRSLGRRRARERARVGVEARGARSEVAEPSLAEDVERRLALNEELARALRALPEAQRIALFLRFHADLPLAAIAERVGAPVPTVKTRITRGLAALREDLDRRYGGERSAWAGLLVVAVDRGGAAKSALAWSASAPVVTASLVVLVLVGALGVWFSRSSRASDATLAGNPANALVAAGSTSTVNAALAGAPRTSARTSALGATSSGALTQQDPGTARVRARFVDDSGASVAGVHVELTGSVQSGSALFAWGERPEVEPVHATSDHDGDIEVVVPAIPCLEWRLEATPGVHARIARRLPSAVRDSLIDLGELVLEAAVGSIAVTVLDGAGAPVTWSDSAYVTEQRSPAENRMDRLRLRQPVEAGFARFDGLPPRVYSVQVDEASATVDLTAGAHVEITLRPNAAVDPTRVLASFHPDLRGKVPVTALLLVDTAGAARAADSVDEAMGRAKWLTVPEGTFTLTFDAPGFEPWSRADIRPGETVGVETRPRSGIRLTVKDASGAPVGLDGGVNVGRHHDLSPAMRAALNEPGAVGYGVERLSALHLHRTPLAPGTEFRLLPGDHRIALFGPRVRRVDIDVTALGEDELRDVEVVVEPASTVSGTVLDALGAPATGAVVELLAPAEQSDGRSSPVTSANSSGAFGTERRKELAYVAVGPDGRFELTRDSQAPVVVRAWRRGRFVQSPMVEPYQASPMRVSLSSVTIDAVEETLAAGEVGQDIILRLLSVGPVQGALAELPEPLRSVDLVLRHSDPPPVDSGSLTLELLRPAQLGPGSAFRFEGVTPGTYDLVALLGGQPHAIELFPRPSLVLAQLDVPPGGLTGVLVTPLVPLPAPVDVRVECTGAVPGAMSVFAQPTGLPAGSAQLATRVIEGIATLPLGRAGRWTLVVFDLQHGWTQQRQVELTPATASVQVDVELALGTVRVVDAAGSPRKGVAVAPARLAIFEVKLWGPASVKTDANGEATLRLPVGNAILTTSGTPHPELPWPPPAGTTLVE